MDGVASPSLLECRCVALNRRASCFATNLAGLRKSLGKAGPRQKPRMGRGFICTLMSLLFMSSV